MTAGSATSRFIDNFDVILLDVQMTFMFDVDRFGPEEDYARTYRAMGGNHLDDATVNAKVQALFDYFMRHYEDPAFVDDFPGLDEAMAEVGGVDGLRSDELALVERTFARHECGWVPEAYADCLREFAVTHRLGVVSNIWAPKDIWLDEFRNADILHLFEKMVFSSDSRSMKPSSALFREAVQAFGASRDRVLFVGDSPACDIMGAQGYGLTAVLTLNHGHPPDLESGPDRMIPDLLDLSGEPA